MAIAGFVFESVVPATETLEQTFQILATSEMASFDVF
jgi:hypothetical protein